MSSSTLSVQAENGLVAARLATTTVNVFRLSRDQVPETDRIDPKFTGSCPDIGMVPKIAPLGTYQGAPTEIAATLLAGWDLYAITRLGVLCKWNVKVSNATALVPYIVSVSTSCTLRVLSHRRVRRSFGGCSWIWATSAQTPLWTSPTWPATDCWW